MSSSKSDPFTSLFPIYMPVLSLAWLISLGLPVLCWITVVRVDILVLVPILEKKHSVFHHWVYQLRVCHVRHMLRYFLYIPITLCVLIIVNVVSYQMLFLHLLIRLYDFILCFVNVVYHIDWLAYTEPSLYAWNEPYLTVMYFFLCL